MNGLEKNYQIIRVGAKFYNYVINANILSSLDIAEEDLQSFGVKRLSKVTFFNNGYYPVVDEYNDYTIRTKFDGENDDRRQLIVKSIIERGLCCPQHNVVRNT